MLKIIIFLYLPIYNLCLNQATITIRDIQDIKQVLRRTSQLDSYCASTFDCTALPIGVRSCGDPSDYLVYSKLSSYNEDLQRLAAVLTKLESEYHKQYSVKSICTIVAQPLSVCVKNRCKRTSFLSSIVYPFGRS